MFIWSLTYHETVFKRYHSDRHFKEFFTYKMAAKINWYRYGTKLRHCHPMHTLKRVAWAGSRTRIHCLEGNYATGLPSTAVQRPSVCLSACPSVPSIDRYRSMRRVCWYGPSGQEIMRAVPLYITCLSHLHCHTEWLLHCHHQLRVRDCPDADV